MIKFVIQHNRIIHTIISLFTLLFVKYVYKIILGEKLTPIIICIESL